MARRSIIVAVAAAALAVAPAGAPAATAPANAPTLATAPYALPATLHWTSAPDVLNTAQAVMESTGACATPLAPATSVVDLDNATGTFTITSLRDGTYCFYVVATDISGATAGSAGLTVLIDTTNPTGTILVSGKAGGTMSGVVPVAATAADALSGVASSVVHVGAIGACPGGAVLGASWDTTSVANGSYEVCNVVTDRAGHSAIATVGVTVANARAPAAVVPAAKPVASNAAAKPVASNAAAGAPVAKSHAKARDRRAPRAPTHLRIVARRAARGTFLVPFTLHWAKPVAKDLDRVVVVLNLKRDPRGPGDGRVVNKGLKAAAGFRLRSRAKAHIALYAYDHTGNVSRPARRLLALSSLIPLRPIAGTVEHKAPMLRWKARKGTVYYNLQLFRNGKRMLVRWPSRASLRVPVRKLRPGTYVWFVWPAIKHGGAPLRFGKLIGRSTFVFRGRSKPTRPTSSQGRSRVR